MKVASPISGGRAPGLCRKNYIIFRSDRHRLYQSGYTTLSGFYRCDLVTTSVAL